MDKWIDTKTMITMMVTLLIWFYVSPMLTTGNGNGGTTPTEPTDPSDG